MKHINKSLKYIILVLFAYVKETYSNYGTDMKGYGFEAPTISTAEIRLHKDLFSGRRRTVFPLSDGVLNVTFGVTLKSIIDFESANEAIVINAFIRQSWSNPSLTWNPAHYGNITKINVESSLTWRPEIYAYANIEDGIKYMGMLNTFKTHIIVSHDGNHYWLAPVTFRFSCGMNVKGFPFDTQKCPLRFGSYTYDSKKVLIQPETVDMKTYSESSEWYFMSMDVVQELVNYADLPNPYCDLVYTVVLKRKPLYFLLHLILPNLILSFLTILVFIIPTQAGEKTGYVITLLLALSWFMVSSGDVLPTSSEGIPLFQYFLGMTLSSVALLSVCLCYSIACYYANSNFMSMPKFIRSTILNRLAPYFNIDTERHYPKWRKRLDHLKKCCSVSSDIELSSLPTRTCSDEDDEDGRLWSSSTTHFYNANEEMDESLKKIFGSDCLHEAHDRVDYILNKYVEENDSMWQQSEWHIVAMTLDYLFLHVFLFVFVSTILSCVLYFLSVE